MNSSKEKMTQVEKFEGDRALKYNDFVDAWIPNYRYFISLIPKLLKDVKDKNLLVAGCGTGNEILAFGNELEKWKMTGVDPSIEMIEQAKNRLGGNDDIQLINGTVDELSQEKSFGAATLLLVLHFLEDNGSKLHLLNEISKRMKTDAPFIILDINGDKKQLNKNLEILKKLIPENIEEEEIDLRITRISNQLHSISEKRLRELLIKAGFKEPVKFYQSTVYSGWVARKE